ncbi:hypothetical protein AB0G79_32505 [Streptomyces sp. NPDC020807]|uniref:hypothetical protein n=1 Tax=Streptomyces sp. NPDC020807 TaxID=3155119 RepID=UPI003407DA4C
MLRALVAPGPDDLFIAGDTHQRIYRNRVSLRGLGISVAGRSTRLRINYRTTKEILTWSTRLLAYAGVDDIGRRAGLTRRLPGRQDGTRRRSHQAGEGRPPATRGGPHGRTESAVRRLHAGKGRLARLLARRSEPFPPLAGHRLRSSAHGTERRRNSLSALVHRPRSSLAATRT